MQMQAALCGAQVGGREEGQRAVHAPVYLLAEEAALGSSLRGVATRS